jgi:hypothetical protein
MRAPLHLNAQVVFLLFFQTKTKEVENGDVSFKPSDDTVEVKSKKESPKTPEPKMVKLFWLF